MIDIFAWLVIGSVGCIDGQRHHGSNRDLYWSLKLKMAVPLSEIFWLHFVQWRRDVHFSIQSMVLFCPGKVHGVIRGLKYRPVKLSETHIPK